MLLNIFQPKSSFKSVCSLFNDKKWQTSDLKICNNILYVVETYPDNHSLFHTRLLKHFAKFTLLNRMSSPDAVHFSIENFNEDFNILTIIPRSNILELNFVHPEGHKTMCFEWIGRSWIFTLCENKSVRLMWNNPLIIINLVKSLSKWKILSNLAFFFSFGI